MYIFFDFKIEHYKGDLHLFNLKQKIKGRAPVTAEEFERLTDISSISGASDDEDIDDKRSSSSSSSSSESSDEDRVELEDKSNRGKNRIRSKDKVKMMFRLGVDSSVLTMFKCILFPKHVKFKIWFLFFIFFSQNFFV